MSCYCLTDWHSALAAWELPFTELVWNEATDEPAALRWTGGEARWARFVIWVQLAGWPKARAMTKLAVDPVACLARITAWVRTAERAAERP